MYSTDRVVGALSSKPAALDVAITLVHVPRPGVLAKVLDVAALGVGALADFAR